MGEARLHAKIAHHYENVGLAEHVSVASFSRAALELMAHGAPPKLLDRTLEAAREEVRHAQMALSLAKVWSGKNFELTGIQGLAEHHGVDSLANFARRTAIEACAG